MQHATAMSSDIEPPMKKSKLQDNDNNNILLLETIDKCIERVRSSDKNLLACVDDDIDQPLQLINVFVGHIKTVKDISRAIQILNERIPLKNLSHLKRVRRQDIILCPTSFLQDMSSIQEYIEYHVTELKDAFDYFKEIDVPQHPPKLTKQYNEARKIWSCNFHPNKYLERLVSDDFFKSFELKVHRKYMEVAFDIMKWHLTHSVLHIDLSNIFKNINVTVVIDPDLDTIVTAAFDQQHDHPMQHSTMLAIDNVAKTQHGGVWSSKVCYKNTVPGLEKELIQYLKEKFTNLKFGVKKSKKESVCSDDAEKSGPYLCTGYNIYMIKEPCLMCAMALVHARAKRIFFSINNEACGALHSKTKLQSVSSLNHHFEVFTGFL